MVRYVALSDVYSSVFCVCRGVRQGSTLTPPLFNLFVDAVIVSLTQNCIDCWVKQSFVGCILYTDDIILLPVWYTRPLLLAQILFPGQSVLNT